MAMLPHCKVCGAETSGHAFRFADYEPCVEQTPRLLGWTDPGVFHFCGFHGKQAQGLRDLTAGEALSQMFKAAVGCTVWGCNDIGVPLSLADTDFPGSFSPKDLPELRSICRSHARELRGPAGHNIFRMLAKTHAPDDFEKLVAALDNPESSVRSDLRWPWRRAAVARYLSSAPPPIPASPVVAMAPPVPGATPRAPATTYSSTVLPFPELIRPTCVAVDPAGSVYVTDQGANRVLMLAAGSATATVLPFADLAAPTAVAVDATGNVYVADGAKYRVSMLAAGSSKTTVLPVTDVDGDGIAVDAAGRLYVISNRRVVTFAAGSKKPTILPIPVASRPHSVVAVDGAGNVYAPNHFGTVRVLVAASTNPRIVGPLARLCGSCTGLAVDSGGNVYVVDDGRRVLMLAAGSTMANVLPLRGPTYPKAIAVDSEGSLFIVSESSSGSQVEKWAPAPDPPGRARTPAQT